MGDAGEGLVDAESRLAERMEEREQEKKRARQAAKGGDPERTRQLESLRLARTEMQRQLELATHPGAQAAARSGDRGARPTDRGAVRSDSGSIGSVVRGSSNSCTHEPMNLRPFSAITTRPSTTSAALPLARLPRLGDPARSVPALRGRGARSNFLAQPGRSGRSREVSPLLDGTVGVEAVRALALGAARQSVERQSPSHRSLRRVATAACVTTRRGSMRSRSDASSVQRSTSRPASFLVALTSIHWREAWKYGERAFRYCQHDAGHAIGALRFAAALSAGGWRCCPLVGCADRDAAGPRSRRGLRRGGAGGARVHRGGDAGRSGAMAGHGSCGARRGGARRDVARRGQSPQREPRRVADHR